MTLRSRLRRQVALRRDDDQLRLIFGVIPLAIAVVPRAGCGRDGTALLSEWSAGGVGLIFTRSSMVCRGRPFSESVQHSSCRPRPSGRGMNS